MKLKKCRDALIFGTPYIVTHISLKMATSPVQTFETSAPSSLAQDRNRGCEHTPDGGMLSAL
jgi:hypothetical protein